MLDSGGNVDDWIRYTIITDSQKAEKSVDDYAKAMVEMANTANVSIKRVADAWVNLSKELGMDSQVSRLINQAASLATAYESVARAKLKALGESEFTAHAQRVGVGSGDAEMQRQVEVSLNQIVAKELSNRVIAQDAVNRADAEALGLQERMVSALGNRAVSERNVGQAKQEIFKSNLAKADADALNTINKLSEAYDKGNVSATNHALANEQIEAATRGASASMKDSSQAMGGLNDKIKSGTASIKEYSQAIRSGLILPPNLIKSLDAIPTLGKKSDWIPNIGAVRTAMEQIMQSVKVNSSEAAKIFRETFRNVPVEAVQAAQRQINQSMMGIRGIVYNTFSDLKAAVQTFFGVSMAMVVFNAATMVSDFFKDAVQKAREAERELRELNLAEALMSKAGIDVSRQDIDEHILYLQKKYKALLPEREFRSIVSETAMLARNFGLTREEIFKMSDDVTYIMLTARLMGNESVKVGNIVNAMLDKNIRTLNTYGVNVLEQTVYQEALRMGLIKQGEALEGTAKLQAIISSVYEQSASHADKLTGSLAGTREELVLLNEVWMDAIKVDIGDWFLDLEFQMLKALKTARELYTVWDELLKRGEEEPKEQSNLMAFLSIVLNPIKLIQTAFIMLGTGLASVIAGFTLFYDTVTKGEGYLKAFENAGVAMSQAIKAGILEIMLILIPELDSELARVMKDVAKWAWGWDIDEIRSHRAEAKLKPETPTAPRDDDGGGLSEEAQKLEDALKKMNTAILEAQIKLEQDMEAAAIKLGRKLVDIDREYLRKREEAYLDFTNKIRDINRSFDEKILDIRKSANDSTQKHRENELKREEDFQNKMLELKEKFLMDLEDALHARDARQVLRLIKQYNLDQEQLTRKHELDKKQSSREEQQRQQKLKQEIEDAERQRQLKLRQAEIEYQDKLAKLKRDEEAEREAAHIAYQREMDDLVRKMHDRLAIIGAGLVEEFNLTKEGLDAITALYMRHYENVRQIYAAMQKMLSGQSYLTPPSPTSGGGGGGGFGTRPVAMAKGGALLANRPTNVVFGEAGAELATFIPLSKMGSGLSSMFGGMGSTASGDGGGIQIDVNLSPDLEARIVRNTLDKASNIIAKVHREKR